jgi:hypothetical protein
VLPSCRVVLRDYVYIKVINEITNDTLVTAHPDSGELFYDALLSGYAG